MARYLLLPLFGLLAAGLSIGDARRQGATDTSAWRKPGVDGLSCGSCHSPDGLEIAVYKFDDATLRRRAAAHFRLWELTPVVECVHRVRAAYGIKTLLDPMKDRPLQPGGQPLSGSTPEARDYAFAKTLPSRLPALFRGISSDADALKARDELLALDTRALRVGIPFNRISEDFFHGPDHATLAHWIPDVAPAPPAPRSAVLAYLADPSDRTLNALVTGDARLRGRSNVEVLSSLKQRALLCLSDDLRRRLLGKPALGPSPVALWDVAELTRLAIGESADQFGLTPALRRKKNLNVAGQLQELRLPWYWAAWTLDPGLAHVGRDRQARRGDYFARFLYEDGPYAVHNLLMMSKKLVENAYRKGEWSDPTSPQHFTFNFTSVVNNGALRRYEPRSAAHRALFRRFAGNAFRMSMRLLRMDIARTGKVTRQDPTIQQLHAVADYLGYAEPERRAADAQLVSDLEATIRKSPLYTREGS